MSKNRAIWSKKDILFLKNNYKTMTRKEMALKLNRTAASTYYKLKALNIKLLLPWSKKDLKFLYKKYNKLKIEEMSIILGRSRSCVSAKLSRLGLVKNKKTIDNIKSGDRFFDWEVITVLGPSKIGKCKNTLVLCKCKCGANRRIKGYRLMNGESRRCKKCASNLVRYKRLIPKGLVSWNALMSMYVHSAKRRGLKFKLDTVEFKKICSRKCFYCGEKPREWTPYKGRDRYKGKGYVRMDTIDRSIIFVNGVDRTNNRLGYIKNNCVTCCFQCNYAKGAMGYFNWLNYLERLGNNSSKNLNKLKKEKIRIKQKNY